MGTHPIFESDFDCLTECCFVKLSAPVVGFCRLLLVKRGFVASSLVAPKNPETFNLGNMMKSYGMPSGAQHTKGPLAQHPLTLFMYCLGGMCLCVWIGPGFFPPQNMINRNWCYSQTPFLYFLGIIAAIVIAPIVNT